MRLIAMKLQGVGPYKDEYGIDFTALTRSRMFLIDGETGAGKTTILDCLTFALYGSATSGDASYKERLRSRFLENDRTETYVDLIFEADGRYYEVRRSPNYRQINRKGDGMTDHVAKAKLVRIDDGLSVLTNEQTNDPDRFFDFVQQAGHGREIASRASEVGPEIEELVGLNREQFSKTIVLAQGQFAAFLRMKPEERTTLIKNLFAAQRYEDIQNELDRRRGAAWHRLEIDRDALKLGIGAARDAATRIALDGGSALEDDGGHWGLDAEGGIDVPSREPDEILQTLRDTVRAVDGCVAAAQNEVSDRLNRASGEMAAARGRHDAAVRMIVAATKERADAELLSGLKSRRDEIDAIRKRLRRSALALPVVRASERLSEINGRKDKQIAEKERVSSELVGMPSADELRVARDEAVTAAARGSEARAKLAMAEEHERLLDDARRCAEDNAKTTAERDHARELADKADEKLAVMPDECSLDQELEEINGLLGSRSGIEARLDVRRKMLGHAGNVVELEKRLAKDEAAERIAAQALREARDRLADAEHRVDLAGAARYARMLKDGHACPVCGSLRHPSPAAGPADVPDECAIDALRGIVEERAGAHHDSEEQMRRTVLDIDVERKLAEDRTVRELELLVKESCDELARLDGLERRRDGLKRDRDALREATAAANKAHEMLTSAEARLRASDVALAKAEDAARPYDAESVRGEREAARQALDEAERQSALVDAFQRRIDRRNKMEREITRVQTTIEGLEDNASAARTALKELLDANGFTDAGTAKAAVIEDAEASRLRDETERYSSDLAEAEANLKRSRNELRESLVMGDHGCEGAYDDEGRSTALGDAIADIDVGELEREMEEARGTLDAANAAQGALRADIAAWRECRDGMLSQAEDWEEAERAFVPLRRMSLLARGDAKSPAERRTTLITYAVTERFRDVLDRANELLRDIHGGVYELRLGDVEGRAGSRTGLPIMVFDRRTELLREPGTLSGGETFFVSLALALALADVIQAENGGISMDTLFVDEGFGTLSDEYLADVFDVLRRISRTRDVGIISHVGQLKELIAERITVTRVRPDAESRLEVLA